MTADPGPGRAPDDSSTGERIALPDGELVLWPAAFQPAEAAELFDRLRREVPWQQEEIRMFGQTRLVPRLVAWYGNPDAVYTYSGVRHEPLPWIPAVAAVCARVEVLSGRRFNSVLLNRYRDGRDGMGWHADDEPELGRNPVIASVSLGAVRRFRLKHRRLRGEERALDLAAGSLLLMGGGLQHHWVHALSKTRATVSERINLTFRDVHASA